MRKIDRRAFLKFSVGALGTTAFNLNQLIKIAHAAESQDTILYSPNSAIIIGLNHALSLNSRAWNSFFTVLPQDILDVLSKEDPNAREKILSAFGFKPGDDYTIPKELFPGASLTDIGKLDQVMNMLRPLSPKSDTEIISINSYIRGLPAGLKERALGRFRTLTDLKNKENIYSIGAYVHPNINFNGSLSSDMSQGYVEISSSIDCWIRYSKDPSQNKLSFSDIRISAKDFKGYLIEGTSYDRDNLSHACGYIQKDFTAFDKEVPNGERAKNLIRFQHNVFAYVHAIDMNLSKALLREHSKNGYAHLYFFNLTIGTPLTTDYFPDMSLTFIYHPGKP